ncbi:MAG: UbiA family prenyltransferase [Deltaproteobacteria bacterium]|nr:UbiA family prenyltransferase [Deltaproteobacteria bacterium]
MRRSILVLLKVSRPSFWIALPLVFCIGLAYGQHGLADPAFRFTPLIVLQMLMLSFPVCLFTFGLNDIHDRESDQMNPRKTRIEGIGMEFPDGRMIRITAFGTGIAFLSVSAATANLANIYFAVILLLLAYVYSVPPWRLKTRPPFDVMSAGIMGFFAPFGLGYSFVDDAAAVPLQAYYFTCCAMGFHAFSTIMDYSVDRCIGDRTFAVAYGKRAAALFPAAICLCSLFLVRLNWLKVFAMAGLLLFIVVAVIPSERLARYFFMVLFLAAVAIACVWIASFIS